MTDPTVAPRTYQLFIEVRAVARVREVRRFAEVECAINQSVDGDIPVSGFGASDCRAACGSHLKRLQSTQSST